MNGRTRGQATLVSVAVALVVLTAAVGTSLGLAAGALQSARRDPGQRRVAFALSERLVAPDGPLATRPNVLDAGRVSSLSADDLPREAPVVGDRPVRVALGDRTVVRSGDPTAGATVRRVVLVERRGRERIVPRLSGASRRTVAVPRRTPRVALSIDPPAGTTVRAVRVNGRVALLNESGLAGNFTVAVSRFETVRLRFAATGPLAPGSVVVTYYPATTTKAVLEVTVGG